MEAGITSRDMYADAPIGATGILEREGNPARPAVGGLNCKDGRLHNGPGWNALLLHCFTFEIHGIAGMLYLDTACY